MSSPLILFLFVLTVQPSLPPPTRSIQLRRSSNPLPRASIPRSWLFGLLRLATKKQLDDDDVPDLPHADQAEALERRYDELVESNGGRPVPIASVLRTLFWRRWVAAGFLYIGWCFSAGVTPWLVAAIVRNLEDENASTRDGVALAGALFVSTLGYNMFINHKFHQLTRNGICIRNLLGSLIYRKALLVRRRCLSRRMCAPAPPNFVTGPSLRGLVLSHVPIPGAGLPPTIIALNHSWWNHSC